MPDTMTMHLNAAFRYQAFLDRLLNDVSAACSAHESFVTVTKNHLRSEMDQSVQDKAETVEQTAQYPLDDLLALMKDIIDQREKLGQAICEAKQKLASAHGSLDVRLDTNRFRRRAASIIERVLDNNKAVERTERGMDYRLDVEGKQTPYTYNVEVKQEEAFDRATVRGFLRELRTTADEVSTALDNDTVSTAINFQPLFDVNDNLDDIMSQRVK